MSDDKSLQKLYQSGLKGIQIPALYPRVAELGVDSGRIVDITVSHLRFYTFNCRARKLFLNHQLFNILNEVLRFRIQLYPCILVYFILESWYSVIGWTLILASVEFVSCYPYKLYPSILVSWFDVSRPVVSLIHLMLGQGLICILTAQLGSAKFQSLQNTLNLARMGWIRLDRMWPETWS